MWPKPSTLYVCRCLLYKLTILNFPSYIVKTLSPYHHHCPFHTSFWLGSSTRRITRTGLPVLFSLYVNDMPAPSRQVQLPLSHSHVRRLEVYLNSSASGYWVGLLSSQRARQCSLPRPRDASQDPGHPSFSESQNLGVTLDTQLTWSAGVKQVGRKAAQILGTWHLCQPRAG
jgi:hypothetical protein